jgi:hypothetical protein
MTHVGNPNKKTSAKSKTSSKTNKKGKNESNEQVLSAGNLGLGDGNIAIDAPHVQNSNISVCLMKKIRVDRLKHGYITVAITDAPWNFRDDFFRELVKIGWKNKFPDKSDTWIESIRLYHPRGDEYGDESKYKRKGSRGNTYNGLTFTQVFSLDKDTKSVIDSIKEKVEYMFLLLQKRDRASCGELFLDYLRGRPHDGLLKHYVTQHGNNDDGIRAAINEEFHAYSTRGVEYQYDENYDKCFVDFDIKNNLKTYAGVNGWDDAPEHMKKAVYKFYPARKELPNWDSIVKERF